MWKEKSTAGKKLTGMRKEAWDPEESKGNLGHAVEGQVQRCERKCAKKGCTYMGGEGSIRMVRKYEICENRRNTGIWKEVQNEIMVEREVQL